MNSLFLVAMLAACRSSIFENTGLALLVIAATAAAYLYALTKNNKLVHAVLSAALLLLDLRFSILLITNIILTIMIIKTETPLKNEIGYPLFNDIELVFDD